MTDPQIEAMGEVVYHARELLARAMAMKGDQNSIVIPTARALALQCAIADLDRTKGDESAPAIPADEQPVDHMKRFADIEAMDG